jgi:hypothetical protein
VLAFARPLCNAHCATRRLLIDCNRLAVDIDSEIIVAHAFTRDKYRAKFPELESLVSRAPRAGGSMGWRRRRRRGAHGGARTGHAHTAY